MLGLLAVAAAGLVIVALPDTGPRLVTFSRTHGPSALDAAGLLLLLVAWLPIPVGLVRHRRSVPRSAWLAGAGVAVVAGAALVIAIRDDLAWWWAPVAALVALQLVLLGVATRRRDDGLMQAGRRVR